MNAIKSFLEHLVSLRGVRLNPTNLPWIRPCRASDSRNRSNITVWYVTQQGNSSSIVSMSYLFHKCSRRTINKKDHIRDTIRHLQYTVTECLPHNRWYVFVHRDSDSYKKYIITGSAVALHCCKAHAKSIGKMGNSTPCKIVTPENIILKLCIRD